LGLPSQSATHCSPVLCRPAQVGVARWRLHRQRRQGPPAHGPHATASAFCQRPSRRQVHRSVARRSREGRHAALAAPGRRRPVWFAIAVALLHAVATTVPARVRPATRRRQAWQTHRGGVASATPARHSSLSAVTVLSTHLADGCACGPRQRQQPRPPPFETTTGRSRWTRIPWSSPGGSSTMLTSHVPPSSRISLLTAAPTRLGSVRKAGTSLQRVRWHDPGRAHCLRACSGTQGQAASIHK
jgi:hypothetical protein